MRLLLLPLLFIVLNFSSFGQCSTVLTAPYAENFDLSTSWIRATNDSYSLNVYWGAIDNCWQRASNTSTYRFAPGPIFDPFYGIYSAPSTRSGSGLYMTVMLDGIATNSPTFLTSPKIDISSMTNPQIEVWSFMTHDTNSFYIQAKSHTATAWTTLKVVSTTTPSYSNTSWEAQNVSIPASLGDTIQVRFLFNEVSGSLVALDDFSIKEDSTCLGPLNVGFSNITKLSALVSWADTNAIHWNLEYGIEGFALGQGTRIDSIMNSAFSFSGLSTGSSYSVYLQGVCDSMNTTTFTGPYTFQTLCDSVQAAFIDSAHFLNIDFDANSSTGNFLTYHWYFGDGNASTGSSASHQYSANGNYTVWLEVTDACGHIDSISKSLTICDSLFADFNYLQNGSSVSVFVDSVISASQVSWHFGDGSTMIGDSIQHVYSNEGIYTVTVAVQNMCGEVDSASKSILACSAPQAAFTYNVVDSTVTYIADTTLNSTYFYWLFGDGTTDSGAVVQHTFNLQTGQPPFQTSLIAFNACNQSDTATTAIPITIGIAEMNVHNIKVYPNPSQGIIYIVLPRTISADFQMVLFDINGKIIEVPKKAIDDQYLIDLSNFPSGEYTLQIQAKGTLYTEKIILNH